MVPEYTVKVAASYETLWNQGYQVVPGEEKLIALAWYLVTMTFRCQQISEIHCSPAIYNVQDKTKNLLSKLVKVN